MTKKVLFVIPDMEIGGIQNSLAERLAALPDDIEAELFCLSQRGAYLEKLPAKIKLLEEDPYAKMSQIPLCECAKMGFRWAFLRLILSSFTKLFGKRLPARFVVGKVRDLGEYDAAISYAQPTAKRAFCSLTNEIVLSCVRAKTKVTFLHCDFGAYGGNCRYHRKLYQKFDRIAAVSESVCARFASLVPEAREKLVTVYHVLDTKRVRALSETAPVLYPSYCLITVARLSEEKGLLRCLALMEALKHEGYRFEWHIVGSGPLFSSVLNEIQNRGLYDTVFLKGEHKNPYRLMKYANAFFLPSYHEAAPMVFEEAAALGLPILTTRTLSAEELVERKGRGIVCENTEEDILRMLRNAMRETRK